MTGPEFAARRQKLELTQDAAAARLGVSRQSLSAWENDRAKIPSEFADALRKMRKPRGATTNKAAGKEPQS